jgi:hypothetical protein
VSDRYVDDDLHDRSTGELLKELAGQTSTLVRQELDLAKAEMSQKGKQAGLGAGLFGGAGVAVLLALGCLSATAIAALAEGMDVWLAALIVTAIWAASAAVLALLGRQRVQEAAPVAPEQTIETVKEDVEWAKTRKSSARR